MGLPDIANCQAWAKESYAVPPFEFSFEEEKPMSASAYNTAIYSIAQEMLDGEDVDGRISSLAGCSGFDISSISHAVGEAADNLRD